MTCLLCDAGLEDAPIVHLDGRTGPLRTVACPSCGLVQSWPRPTQAELDRYYASGQYRREFPAVRRQRPDGTWAEPDAPDFPAVLDLAAEQCAPVIARHLGAKPGATVAEVGCGDGRVCWALGALGIDVVGVERDPAMASQARARGVRVVDALPYSVDAVIALQVLEHFADPVARAAEWVRHVRPGGWVYVEVPNVERPYGGLSHFFQYPHVVNFSPATLALALLRAGCEHVEWATDDHVLIARGAVPVDPKPRTYAEARAAIQIEVPSCDDVCRGLREYQWRAWESPGARVRRFLRGTPLAALGDDAEDLVRREFQSSANLAGAAISHVGELTQAFDAAIGSDPDLWDPDPFLRGFLAGRVAGYQRAQLALSHVGNALTRAAVEGDRDD